MANLRDSSIHINDIRLRFLGAIAKATCLIDKVLVVLSFFVGDGIREHDIA